MSPLGSASELEQNCHFVCDSRLAYGRQCFRSDAERLPERYELSTHAWSSAQFVRERPLRVRKIDHAFWHEALMRPDLGLVAEFERTHDARKAALKSRSILRTANVLEVVRCNQRWTSLPRASRVVLVVDRLSSERGEKALRDGIVPAVASYLFGRRDPAVSGHEEPRVYGEVHR